MLLGFNIAVGNYEYIHWRYLDTFKLHLQQGLCVLILSGRVIPIKVKASYYQIKRKYFYQLCQQLLYDKLLRTDPKDAAKWHLALLCSHCIISSLRWTPTAVLSSCKESGAFPLCQDGDLESFTGTFFVPWCPAKQGTPVVLSASNLKKAICRSINRDFRLLVFFSPLNHI